MPSKHPAPASRLLSRRLTSIALLALGLLLAAPSEPAAHEIPNTVTVLIFIKPEGTTLRTVLRVPLAAMRDIEVPQRGLGYLDIPRADSVLRDAAQIWLADYLQLFEGDQRLASPRLVAVRASLPSERVFTSFDSALAHTVGPPLAAETDVPWQQAMLDVVLDYRIASASSKFSINPSLAHLGIRTTTVLRFLPAGGSERAYQYLGNPGLVHLDPRWYQAALQFVRLGFFHILSGLDHLLFVFCLVIPIRRLRPLIAIVTSFTVAHSITLIGSALGFAPDALWFPPLIEVLIALSIVYMACENMLGSRLDRRWLIAFGFGLVHGFGFSFALRESLQFAGAHLATSLFSFNVGVELGQIVVLILTIPVLEFLFRRTNVERAGTILLSALVAHTAWHWMLERGAVLREYEFVRPTMDAVFMISAMRFAIAALVLGGVAYGLSLLFGRSKASAMERSAPPTEISTPSG
ncbi:MAG: HupE/UreJ family protein [Gemmatimonadaceae bacterium]